MRESFDELTRADARSRGEDLRAPLSCESAGKSSGACVSKGAYQRNKDHQTVCNSEVCDFVDMLLTCPEDQATRQFLTHVKSDGSARYAFDALLAGAAQELGARWLHDTCSFADVTLGMGVIHRLLRRYSDALCGEVPIALDSPGIFITPLPGEAHIFASSLLAEYFRAGGWRVYSGVNVRASSIIRSVKEHHIDVAAITVSSIDKVNDAAVLIKSMRCQAKNDDLLVLVGGPPFLTDPGLHQALGADATATDAFSALELAGQLIANDRNLKAGNEKVKTLNLELG